MSTDTEKSSTIKVWDPLVRIFHWSLVLSFALAFITEDDWLSLHVQAGYAVSLLIGFRLIWGLIGTRQARFFSFVKSPAVVMSYLRQMLTLKVPHYLGHNPVAAVMVIALLCSIALTAFTGMVTIASEGQGPLANTVFASWRGDWIEEVHEFFANFTLVLIVAHVSGVVVSSLLERENLVKAMVTGRKKNRLDWQDTQNQEGS
ncbi:MAG: cytochrome b/b6 domain-containing protein [Gammaproteobacteria bacterium]|nr:cytochrome b/b6 domain-containing protein [Gammaproteobacteria bacterium]